MHTDALLYRLFQERPATLFEIAALGGDGDGYRLTAVEVKETAFRLDGVLLPPADAPVDAPLLFLENQFQALTPFYARWLAAIFLYLYRQAVARPWLAVAVFPTRAVEPPLGLAFSALEPAGLLRRVYLEDLLTAPDPGRLTFGARLLRLVVLATADLPGEVRVLADAARAGPDPLALMDLIETILVYKLPNLSRDEIKAMLHLPDTDLKQTRFYQEVFAEGMEEGLEEGLKNGLEKGREKGREEGRAASRRETALNLLRLTNLADAEIAAITGLGVAVVAAMREVGHAG